MKKNVRYLSRKFWLHLPFGCFVVAILCLCFAYGAAVGTWHVFPYGFLNAGWDSLKELRNKPDEQPHYLHPARYEGEGVVVCEREQVCPGITLLTGPWKNGDDWNPGSRLPTYRGLRPVLGVSTIIAVALLLRSYRYGKYTILSRQAFHDGILRAAAQWIDQNADPDDLVFTETLGYIGYHNHNPFVDYPGLAIPDVPSMTKDLGFRQGYARVIEEKQPDYIVITKDEWESLPIVTQGKYAIITRFAWRNNRHLTYLIAHRIELDKSNEIKMVW